MAKIQARLDHFLAAPPGFYRRHYHHVLMGLILLMLLIIAAVGVVMTQILKRPLPTFDAVSSGQRLFLSPSTTPNLLPETVIRWSTEAAIAAYNFDFANYATETAAARVYFTSKGWADYTQSLATVVQAITQNQLNVTGVVNGTPVIANQGDMASQGYSWRVQIPFLVSYVSAGLQGNVVTQSRYVIVLTLTHVPTSQNPQGIGIDQFQMVSI